MSEKTATVEEVAQAGSDVAAFRRNSADAHLLESVSRPLLELAQQLTGLDSTYLTEIRSGINEQEILFSLNQGEILIPEGLTVSWQDTLCRRALESGRRSTSDVPTDLPGSEAARQLGLQTYVTVPVLTAQNELLGTLCGASAQAAEVSPQALDVLERLARLIAEQWERDRLLDDAVRRANDAEAALRARATYLAMAEHKLKSPLALLRGWSDILVESWQELPAEVIEEALQTLQEASRDAVRQVDQLLLEARTGVQAQALERVRVSVSDMVAQVVRQLRGIGSAQHHVVLGRVDEAAVIGDRQALWQLLWHLGENAVKYSPDGGTIAFSVELRGSTAVLVTVSDEGIGVPEDVDIFSPFARGANGIASGIAGSGLGLHIVHNLTRALGGTVRARPGDQRGSVFEVILPPAEPAAG